MKYRSFGALDWKVSALGFGAMRLPIIGADRGNINEPLAIQMIRYAIDHGVNYVDTAYPYHNGNSEKVVGKALQDGYRDDVKIATKMPIRRVTSPKDLDTIFHEQRAKLQVDKIDCYLFHGLDKESWIKLHNLNALRWAEKKMAEDRIGYLGFSFHDEYEVFKDIIDGYEGWTFCQILYNYMDAEHQAGINGLKYAASKGLAVVVMEPIAGGRLALPPPPEIQTLWDDATITRSPADLALQWVWNHPEVSVVLSGMSTMQQVTENVASASHSGPGILSGKEFALISKLQREYRKYGFIGCSDCGYCQPCPEGVEIPQILALINDYDKSQGDHEAQQEVVSRYHETIPPEKSMKNCAKCRECEEECPQQLPISKLLEGANFRFERHRG